MSYHYDIVYFMDPAILKQDMKFAAKLNSVKVKSTINNHRFGIPNHITIGTTLLIGVWTELSAYQTLSYSMIII